MTYPTIDQYVEAVQNPNAFSDPTLKQGRVATNSLGLPLVLGGGFALTFTVTSDSRKYAVRCFHKESPGIEERYDKISKGLSRFPDGPFVRFEFLEQGIRVNGGHFPVIKMEWAEGDILGAFIEDHHDDKALLKQLLELFRSLEQSLRSKSIAHGDLQNGNVLLGSMLKLVDYDGIYVPGMAVGRGAELGHRHFQHPHRSPADFGPTMDRFSFIVIDLSFRALLERADLFQKYSNGENIIFSANDFVNPAVSAVFADVRAIPSLTQDVERFARICDAPPAATPTLEDFLAGRNQPAASVVIATPLSTDATAIPVTPTPYIGAFQVVNATDFDGAMRVLGDRVELVGKIVKMQIGKTRYRDPYAFLMFGPKDLNIVRITIWSEGLQNLDRHKIIPDHSWTGQWVSVTGLIEKPYRFPKKGNLHVGITIADSSQLRFITEQEAKRHLQYPPSLPSSNQPTQSGRNGDASRRQTEWERQSVSPQSSPSTGNAAILDRIGSRKSATTSRSTQPPRLSVPSGVSNNQKILRGLRNHPTSQTPKTPQAPPPSPAPQPASGTHNWIWMLVILAIIILLALFRSGK